MYFTSFFFFFSVDLVPYKLDLDLRFSGYRITATSTREVSDFCLSRYLRLVQVNLTSSYDNEFVQFILILFTPFIMTVSTWFAFFYYFCVVGSKASIIDPKDNDITIKNAKIVVESQEDDEIQVSHPTWLAFSCFSYCVKLYDVLFLISLIFFFISCNFGDYNFIYHIQHYIIQYVQSSDLFFPSFSSSCLIYLMPTFFFVFCFLFFVFLL